MPRPLFNSIRYVKTNQWAAKQGIPYTPSGFPNGAEYLSTDAPVNTIGGDGRGAANCFQSGGKRDALYNWFVPAGGFSSATGDKDV